MSLHGNGGVNFQSDGLENTRALGRALFLSRRAHLEARLLVRPAGRPAAGRAGWLAGALAAAGNLLAELAFKYTWRQVDLEAKQRVEGE